MVPLSGPSTSTFKGVTNASPYTTNRGLPVQDTPLKVQVEVPLRSGSHQQLHQGHLSGQAEVSEPRELL